MIKKQNLQQNKTKKMKMPIKAMEKKCQTAFI